MPSSAGKTCALDRKSTRLNSSHGSISYAVFCLKKTERIFKEFFLSPSSGETYTVAIGVSPAGAGEFPLDTKSRGRSVSAEIDRFQAPLRSHSRNKWSGLGVHGF